MKIRQTTSVTVVVPSVGRPPSLARTLVGINMQGVHADEVIVVARPDDSLTQEVALAHGAKVVLVDVPGAVQAVQRGIAVASSDVVAIIDDDAVPASDWVERIRLAYTEDVLLGALGGRDNINADRTSGTLNTQVGVMKHGKIIGNHHLGHGQRRSVVHLKGANMTVRKGPAATVPLADMVIGTGAQIRWEFVLSAAIAAAGYGVQYDPRVQVDHFPAARPADDARTAWTVDRSRVLRRNEAVAVFAYMGMCDRVSYAAHSALVGDSRAPGLLLAPILRFVRLDRDAFARSCSGLRGLWGGLIAGLSFRTRRRSLGYLPGAGV